MCLEKGSHWESVVDHEQSFLWDPLPDLPEPQIGQTNPPPLLILLVSLQGSGGIDISHILLLLTRISPPSHNTVTFSINECHSFKNLSSLKLDFAIYEMMV